MKTELAVIHEPSMRTFITDLEWKFEGIYQIYTYIFIQQVISELSNDLNAIKVILVMNQANHSGELTNLFTSVSVSFGAE